MPFDLGSENALKYFAALADDLVKTAAQHGVVITVEQKPQQPLAMGHHVSVVSVRAARKE